MFKEAWRYISAAWSKAPYFTLFTTIVSLSTTFIISMLWTIGQEFVPIVDKSHLVGLLLIYAAAATLVVRMVIAFAALLHGQAEVSVDDLYVTSIRTRIADRGRSATYSAAEISTLAERLLRRRGLKAWVPWSVAYLVILPGAVTLFGVRDLSHIGRLVSLPGFVSTVAELALALIAFGLVWYMSIKGHPARLSRGILALGNILVILATLHAAGVWVDYLRNMAPRLSLQLESESRTQSVSIVLPATDGFLAFVDEAQRVQFIPWSSVRSLRSR